MQAQEKAGKFQSAYDVLMTYLWWINGSRKSGKKTIEIAAAIAR